MSDKEADLESVIRSGQSAQDRRRMTLVNDDPPDYNPAEGQSEETIEQLRSSGQAAQDRRQITSVEDDLTEGQDETVEEVDKDVFIPFVHRPLSRYVNALATSGLTIVRMEEPAPPPGFLARANEYADAVTIPRLLLLITERR